MIFCDGQTSEINSELWRTTVFANCFFTNVKDFNKKIAERYRTISRGVVKCKSDDGRNKNFLEGRKRMSFGGWFRKDRIP